MSKVWPWIIGVGIGLIVIAMLFTAVENRHSYWVARGTVPRAIQVVRIDNMTLVRFPCGMRTESISTAKACGYLVWKK
jgi:hypothetical protein